jgi:hypothetical protein
LVGQGTLEFEASPSINVKVEKKVQAGGDGVPVVEN